MPKKTSRILLLVGCLMIAIIVTSLFFTIRTTDMEVVQSDAFIPMITKKSASKNSMQSDMLESVSNSEMSAQLSQDNSIESESAEESSVSSSFASTQAVEIIDNGEIIPQVFSSTVLSDFSFSYPQSWSVSESRSNDEYSVTVQKGSQKITLSALTFRATGFAGPIPCGTIVNTVGSFYEIQTDHNFVSGTTQRLLETVFIHKDAVNNFGEFFSIDTAIENYGYDINPIINNADRDACFIPDAIGMKVRFVEPQTTVEGELNTAGFFSITTEGQIDGDVRSVIETLKGVTP